MGLFKAQIIMKTSYEQSIDAVVRSNTTLRIAIIALSFALVGTIAYHWTKPNQVTVDIPPGFAEIGGQLKSGTKAPQNIFGFTIYVVQYLNNWSKNAEEDYEANIHNTSFYTTTKYQKALSEDFNSRKNLGGINELSGRTRSMSQPREFKFDENSVVVVDHGVWDVTVYFQLQEWIGNSEVKNELVKNVYRVLQVNDNPEENKWGLKIDRLISSERVGSQ